jgi:membrane protein CcdC involved in cytochrome C biogenesis
MSPTMIITVVIYLAVAVAVLALLMQRRPVNQRTLLLPVILSVVLGFMYLRGNPDAAGLVAILIGGVLGIGTGLFSAQFMRVSRDAATGVVVQQGTWLYLVVLLVLVALRLAVRAGLLAMGLNIDPNLVDIGFYAMACGNLLGRSLIVALRAAALSGGSITALPVR